jgi:hypothetical protein
LNSTWTDPPFVDEVAHQLHPERPGQHCIPSRNAPGALGTAVMAMAISFNWDYTFYSEITGDFYGIIHKHWKITDKWNYNWF